jgi:CRP/FNR family transcriptional regulator, anaerobic regulatory protein
MKKGSTPTPQNELLLEYLNKFNLSPTTINLIQNKIIYQWIKKGDKFSSYGKVCKKIGVLLNGLLYASYQPDGDKEEIVSRFFYAPKNLIVTSFESLHTGKAANESITAIEDSFLVCLERDVLNDLYKTNPEINYVGRQIAEQSYIQALQRIHDLQTMDGRQRVQDLFKKNPDLFNRVQKQQMASYLGMNRNALTKFLNGK